MIFSNKIILGTANFGKSYGLFKNKVDRNKIRNILNFAKKNGIKYLDTAKEYGKLICLILILEKILLKF